ncbi:proline-rich transmembrane protein 1-like [Lethenteron reissneri]|uniref:proline-rich transmembrane protein 1-like n=1 Tax=Lethenteron reissneri TaxID=7753 RepID=UPI002AB5F46A|nr:proline-rich transmembrane protein 1-like [Lethenteron reissneri]XP_061435991.1 proline-rich transmembrane protein 1-like [Lethenteron reissneri]
MDGKFKPEDFPHFPPPYSVPDEPGHAQYPTQPPPAYQLELPPPPTYQAQPPPPAYQTQQQQQPLPPPFGYPYPRGGHCGGAAPGYVTEIGPGEAYRAQHVIVLEHGPGFGQRRQGPQDYLSWSLITLLCLFWPLGIPALFYSFRVRDALATGDLERASKYSATCRNLNIAGMVLGIMSLALIIIVVPIVFLSNSYTGHYSFYP